MSPVNWILVLAALMGVFFVGVVGAAAKSEQESESSGKVPALGLIVEWAGKIFVIANSEEQWVFPLPQGFLFFDGEDEALWAPNLKQLVARYLRAQIADTEHVLNKFVDELEKEKKRGNELGINFWKHQVTETMETLIQYDKILRAVKAGEAAIKLVDFDELQKIIKTSEVEVI